MITFSILAALWVTLMAYILGIAIHRRWDTLSLEVKVACAPIYPLFIFLDVVVANVIFGTLYFYEPPKEWLLTSKLKRLKREGSERQQRRAERICSRWLNPFDTKGGGHC